MTDLIGRTQADGTDRQILALLRENARASTAELARRLGLSRTTIQSRIERLERAGIIVGYTVRIAEEHERGQLKAYIMVTLQPKQSGSIEAALRKMPEVRSLHAVSGPFDLVVVAVAPSVDEMNATIDRIGALTGVERTTSAVVLSTRIDR
ncbi:Lrp/AsnC family transcriptional regulator [Reyranella sp. CPCC 100927]|uniref:Lrp/AsnC family transcriptional regulator n=1 Tax=Reyranella sp. CPCC 100927 TaxID=2599616 RepID=UPI0011B737E3|nr:Lrp/AsnC family transcriptional regulator [Reyranella sp. CPCC 100927]TWT12567.1 Lrp/AsnC family transcriptional regulator [Reyranella sp. CPCC 100927]